MNKKLLIIFILAFFIRLIALNQSLWLDEATTARVVGEYGFLQIISRFSPNDFHPPLYYFLMKGWTNIFGYSEVALRFPSIIFSLLTGYFVYKIAKLLNGYISGIYAAVFFLFNPLIVYYSQEARMYMMATFLLTASIYFLHELTRMRKRMNANERIRSILFFNLFAVLAFFTFYGSIFLIVPMLLYLLYKKQHKVFLVSLFIIIYSLFILSPLLYHQLINAKIFLKLIPNWSLVLGKANLKNLLLIPLKFSVGRISFYPKWLYWLLGGGWTLFILYQISNIHEAEQVRFREGKNQKYIAKIKNIYLFYYLLILPLILGIIISFFTPLLQYFRFLYLLPIVSILLAYSPRPSLSDRIKILTFLGYLTLSLVYLFNSAFHREDWKSLAKSLPAEKTILMIESSSDPLKYYNPKIKIESLTKLSDRHKKLNEIWVIPYTADIYGINYAQFLLENKFYLDRTLYFRGLTIEFWRKKLKV